MRFTLFVPLESIEMLTLLVESITGIISLLYSRSGHLIEIRFERHPFLMARTSAMNCLNARKYEIFVKYK